MRTGDLFGDDKIKVVMATEAGIAKAARRLDSEEGAAWLQHAIDTIRAVCETAREWAVDDVWAALGEEEGSSPYHSQIGNAVRYARLAGWMRFSGRWVESKRPSRHRSSVRVWKSNLYRS